MTPAKLRDLLTAALDGELTVAEQKAVRRLLRESKPARTLFGQLKADAVRLRSLPRVAAPAELAENVLAVIGERAMRPTPLPPIPPRPKFNWARLPIWANVAAAAGVLLVITLGSYVYFAASDQFFAEHHGKAVAKRGQAKPPTHPQPEPAIPDPPPERRDRSPDPLPQPDAVARRGTGGPEVGPEPRQVIEPGTLTSPPQEMPEIEPFQPHKIRLSHLARLRDLPDDPDARKKLAAEMRKDELIRLDLFCQSAAKGYERVVAALKKRGITVVTDGYARDRISRHAPTELMLFTEALTPDEVAQIMAALGAEDRAGPGLFDTLVAAPFLGEDLVKLGRLLGVPNVTSKLPKAKGGVDVRTPLPEGTAQHVANSLSGLGTKASRSAKPAPMAVVVAYSPRNAHPAASPEIRQFVERRGDRQPDTKPLMLVLKIISK